jgi:hypothetical protein
LDLNPSFACLTVRVRLDARIVLHTEGATTTAAPTLRQQLCVFERAFSTPKRLAVIGRQTR